MHFFNKDNDDLVEELKEKGITDKNILNSIKRVPRELFVKPTHNYTKELLTLMPKIESIYN